MPSLGVFLLALGLAMDATAVAGARGLAAKRVRSRDALLVAVCFGGFQAAMPAIGLALGTVFATRVAGWGHWVTFVVLGGIGAKMLHDAVTSNGDDDGGAGAKNVFGLKTLAVLGVATSIDALAAGVVLGVAKVGIAGACAVIGVVTAVLSFAGVHAGHRFGTRLGKRLEVMGGVILIGLAIKAVAAHYLAAA